MDDRVSHEIPATGPRGIAVAADGSLINAGDTVLVVATVVGAAGPVHDLPAKDTGVVAVDIEGYDGGRSYTTPHYKVCTTPGAIATVIKKATS